jgi:predicted porin
MKKTIIASAVSAVFMVPVSAQAEVEASMYGFVHNMISATKTDARDADDMNTVKSSSTTDMATRGSRFGFKASSDLGNGLTASLQQEFGVATDTKKTGLNTRIGKVGISGGFGSVNFGRQWSTFYNTIGVYMDPTSTVAVGGYGGAYINSNTIQYTNSMGPIALSLEARVDDSNDGGGDGHAGGVSINPMSNVTIAAVVDSTGDTDKTGFAVQFRMGDYYASYAMHDTDTGVGEPTDYSVFLIGGGFGATNGFIGVGNTDNITDAETLKGSGTDPDTVMIHIDHDLGGGLKLLYEGLSTDGNEDDGHGDKTQHVLGLKLSF